MSERMTGSQAVIRGLLEQGVTTLFGYIGGAIMPVYDALYDVGDQLNHVLTRHEQGAVHAAQGYARVSGRPGVCFATSGPGATNLITGIADAMLDSTPLVCITGQVGSALLGSDAFQETDIVGISVPITKWNTQVTSAAEIPAALAKAFYVATSGRPGPVLVDITRDAQLESFDYVKTPRGSLRSYRPYPRLDPAAVAQAAALIDAAERPLILSGHGVLLSGAAGPLMDLAERASLPVASTLLGLGAVPVDHPLYQGMLGMHGNYAPNVLTNEADLLIAVGMRFDDRVTGRLSGYAPQAKVIHIEIDGAEIGKNVPVDLPLLADARQALEALVPLVAPRQRPAWLARFAELRGVEQREVIDAQLQPGTGPLRMGEVIHHLSELTAGQATVVTDVGQHQMKTGRYYRFGAETRFVTSGGLGTMGFGLPASVGAALATDRPVIAVIGDGGFQMTLQELATLEQNRLPVKIFILNNNFLGMVRQWQELFFDRKYSYTQLTNPDFVTIARGYRVPGERIEDRAELVPAIRRALETPGPYLVDVSVMKEDNVFPMIQPGDTVSEIRLK